MGETANRDSSTSFEEERIPFISPRDDYTSSKTCGNDEFTQDHRLSIATASMLIASIFFIISGLTYPTDSQCTNVMSIWSPMLEAIEYEWRHFNTESPNIYYGTPNDDLETAWGKLWKYGSTGIHDEKLHLLNKSLEVSWKHLPDELGGGVQAFFEGFHQIHCLDLVRQFSYRDEYDYSDVPAFLKHADTLYDHVDHCLETLRINVMCNADTTPYLIEVMEGGEKVVRTDALYRCRNFDNMIEWANKNIILPYNTTEERLKTIREEKKKVEYGINGGQAI